MVAFKLNEKGVIAKAITPFPDLFGVMKGFRSLIEKSGGYMKGKIVKGIAGFYYVHAEDDVIYECKAKGKFRKDKKKPLVGDLVRIQCLDKRERIGNIEELLPRTSELIRPMVANVDQALVMFAATSPAPNLNLLDRFLITMQKQNIPVIICFNKVDLASEEEQRRLREIYKESQYQIHFISVCKKIGLDVLESMIRGKTTVLAGPSGVGKSSLVNWLHPQANMETGQISHKIQRGRHTTRHSEFFNIGNDTYVLDTPGFSSIFIDQYEPNELKDYFPEFTPYEEACKFVGCVHIGEKVCGVKQAVQDKKISQSRYDNYVLFYQECKQRKRY